MRLLFAALLLLVACEDGPDEVVCEVEVNGVTVCIDLKHNKSTCEKDWGGTASNAEVEPGGPYKYCEDLYAQACDGTITEEGPDFTASHNFYANSQEDCAAADGGKLVTK